MKNKGLYIVLFLAVILGGSFFIFNLRGYLRGENESNDGERLREHQEEELKGREKVAVKSEEYYANLFRSKNLFKALGKEKSLLFAEGEEAAEDLNKELAKFELMGVVSSGGTAKALIKDTTNGKTFYGVAGEKLDAFTIKEILSDKIILERGGKNFELKL